MTGVLEDWEARGAAFSAGGVASRAWTEGDGEAVVCLHGVPASAFIYRKVLGELAARGLRGVAFDLPGLGLADRPRDFDYSWSGLAAWTADALDALGIGDFHLVVHDIGGPIGLDAARRSPDRLRSVTLLNTMVRVASFKRPWVMEPFARRGIGEIYLRSMTRPAFAALMKAQGILADVPAAELAAYVSLLKREDGGRAFLRIMRGFERTPEFEERIVGLLRTGDFPRQVVWGDHDPALPVEVHGEQAREAAGVERIERLPGRHFVMEDAPAAIGHLVATLARSRPSGGS